jgi:hypothetical protein
MDFCKNDVYILVEQLVNIIHPLIEQLVNDRIVEKIRFGPYSELFDIRLDPELRIPLSTF